jgi:hypothetical protein
VEEVLMPKPGKVAVMPGVLPVIPKPSSAPASAADAHERFIPRLRLAAERAASDLEADTVNLTGITDEELTALCKTVKTV